VVRRSTAESCTQLIYLPIFAGFSILSLGSRASEMLVNGLNNVPIIGPLRNLA